MAKKETKRKYIVGEIIKIGTTNTVKVRVESKYPHAKYGKIVKHHTKYLVHVSDKFKDLEVGTWVKFSELAPVSKLKKWEIIEIIN